MSLCAFALLVQIIDSDSPLSGGQPGLWLNYGNINATHLDDWEGGDLSAGIKIPVAIHHYQQAGGL